MKKRVFALLLVATLVLSLGATPPTEEVVGPANTGSLAETETISEGDATNEETDAEGKEDLGENIIGETKNDNASEETSDERPEETAPDDKDNTDSVGLDDTAVGSEDEIYHEDDPADDGIALPPSEDLSTAESDEDVGKDMNGDTGELPIQTSAEESLVPSEATLNSVPQGFVSVRFEGDGVQYIKNLSCNGATYNPQEGPVTVAVDASGKVDFAMELPEGYTVQTYEMYVTDEVIYDHATKTLHVTDQGYYDSLEGKYNPGDGTVTVFVGVVPTVCVTFTGETDKIQSLSYVDHLDKTIDCLQDAKAGKAITRAIYTDSNFHFELPENYIARFSDSRCSYQAEDEMISLGSNFAFGTTWNVTITIIKIQKAILNDDGNYVESIVHDYTEPGMPTVVMPGDRITLWVKLDCTLDVDGGNIGQTYFSLDTANGTVSKVYVVVADGTGDLIITTKAGSTEDVPVPVKLEYIDPDNKITNKTECVYAMYQNNCLLYLADNYGLRVEGDCTLTTYGDGTYSVVPTQDAKKIKVIAFPISTGVTLTASNPQALAKPVDFKKFLYYFTPSLDNADIYLSGDTMPTGRGCVLIKNGYAIDTCVSGGQVQFLRTLLDDTDNSIYNIYLVEASERTLMLPIVPSKPYRLVDAKVSSSNRISWSLSSVTGAVGSGHGTFRIIADETIDFYVYGEEYELVAVSGCSLSEQHTDEYGNIYYVITPDETGNTNLEIATRRKVGEHTHVWGEWWKVKDPSYGACGEEQRFCSVCIQAESRLIPALEVKTDASVKTDIKGVDMDAQAQNILNDTVKNIVSTVTSNRVPSGMDWAAADKLKIALESIDNDEVPTVSAELYVNLSEDMSIQHAAVVYEIGVCLFVNNEEICNITKIDEPISISLPLPVITGRIIYVVREHDGKLQRLDTTVSNGKAIFSTSQFSKFAIVCSNDINDSFVEAIPDQPFTGAKITPKVTVTIMGPDGLETLREGIDYTISYTNNLNVGEATIIITGMGDFAGTSKVVRFSIVLAPAATQTPRASGISPQTGDETPMTRYFGLMTVCIGGLIVAARHHRKKRI